MGGRVSRDLSVSVTHLIAGEVGSKKYLVAASLKKPILLPSWVKTLWDKSQQRYKTPKQNDFVLGAGKSYGDTDCFLFQIDFTWKKINPVFLFSLFHSFSIMRYTDVNMEDYACPVFLGCTICVTGLSSSDRKEIQRLTAEHGGQYTGQLKMNECTHLIVQEPKGRTYRVKITLTF